MDFETERVAPLSMLLRTRYHGAEGGAPRPLTMPLDSLRGWTWFTDREILFSARLATRYQLWRIPADGIVTPPLAFPGAGEDAADPTLAWRTATAGIPSRPLLAYQSAAHIMLVDGFR